MSSRLFVALTLMAAIFVASCATGAPNTGRAYGRSIDDSSASLAIKSRMMRSNADFSAVDVNVTDGLVLLTGVTPTPLERLEAERIAWSAPKVAEVANEIIVADKARSNLGANDGWISAQVRARLTADSGVRGSSIDVETYEAVVYLLGRTRTAGEVDRATAIASLVPGVARVVSYLRVDDTTPVPQTPVEQRSGEPRDEPALRGGRTGS